MHKPRFFSCFFPFLCAVWIMALPPLFSEPSQKICLNMIVKDEREVIEKCLGSVKPFIQYWVIIDTGSTDGTQEVIRNIMKDIPGELHERPWLNFEHNRNEALEYAKNKGDYLLFIDADEYLSAEPGFSLPHLDKDYYDIVVTQIGAVTFLRPTLINTKLPWKWHGVLHESLDCSIARSSALLMGITNLCNTNAPSGRSKDPNKYLKDAALLEEALKKDPNNSRYVFYLAQSYLAANKTDLALTHYEKRAAMTSYDHEQTFFTFYNIGTIHESKGDYERALTYLFKAYEFRPTRAEPLFHAAIIYRKMGNPFLGYLLSKHALSIPYPQESCVEYMTYDYAILVEFANCALLTGRWQEGLDASNMLLSNPRLPEDISTRVLANCKLAQHQLELMHAVQKGVSLDTSSPHPNK
jgi:glycosyltransferase involved in cell wall biosynthesis